MRSREAKRHRSREKSRTFFCLFLILGLSVSCVFSGCIRVVGTAGYAKVNADGETTVKQASFDMNNPVQKSKTPGSITI